MILDFRFKNSKQPANGPIAAKCANRKSQIGNRKSEDGVAALMIIVLIATASLVIGLNTSFLSLGELDIGYTSQKGSEALSVTQGCMDETLRRIRLDTNYGVGAGTINLTTSNGSCTIDVTDLGNDQRRIIITGTTGEYNRKIENEITLSGNVITIDEWEELTN